MFDAPLDLYATATGLPDFGGISSHPKAGLVGSAYVLGLGGFIVLVTLDAIYRPYLFDSLFWEPVGASSGATL